MTKCYWKTHLEILKDIILLDMDAKIQIYASVMLAMPDTTISTAYEQTSKLLAQYVNSDEEEENDD